MNNAYIWGMLAVIAAVTAITRFLPFAVFNSGKTTPKIITKLSRCLPYAIMGMLVVYCLKNISFSSVGGFLPQLAACLVVAILYIWKRNTLVSMIAGTVFYMVLIQNFLRLN